MREISQKVIAGMIWAIVILSAGSQNIELALAIMMGWMVMSWPPNNIL